MVRPLWLSSGYWRYLFRPKVAVASALAGFGALWLVAQLLGFFFPPGRGWIQSHPLLFVGCGALYVVYQSWPRARTMCRLANRDIWIELTVNDIFSCQGALVISATRTFETDTESGRIATDSLQGQFTAKYYQSCAHLKADVNRAVAALPSAVRGNVDAAGNFPVGTTLRVEAPARTAYFVALPEVNTSGTAKATFEDLRQALPGLWECIFERGQLETIAIPVMGSGRARILAPREAIVREIVQSFVAACAAGRFCDKLTVVISRSDFHKHQVNFRELAAFVRHVCTYTSIGETAPVPTGVGTQ